MAPSELRLPPRLLGLFTLWLLWLFVPASTLAQEARLEVRASEPATLTFWNRPIVTFHAEVMGITPKERIRRSGKKIEEMIAEGRDKVVTAVPGTLANLSGYWIQIDGLQVFGLLPQDADQSVGQTLEELVRQTIDRLQAALDARREHQQLAHLLPAAGLSLVGTLAYAVALWGVMRLHRRTLGRELRLAKVDLKVGGFALSPILHRLERGVIKLTTFGLVVVATYLWLTFVFHRFSFTRPWGDGLAEYLLGLLQTLAAGALGAIPGLFTVLIIFLITRFLVRAVEGFFHAVEQRTIAVPWLAPDTAKVTRRLTAVLIWVFAVTVAYPYIPGSESEAFKGISVLVGLMVSLGSAGLINQVMSGLVVAYSRALHAGEYVKVGDTEGTVSEVGILSTKVITPKREAITVPNAVLVGSAITNYSRLAEEAGATVGTTVTIGYDTPWRQVHAMLELAATRTPGVRKEPRPFVLQRSLSDFYPEYQLVVHIDRAEQRIRILSDLHASIQDVFNEYGVQIMSPNFEAQPEGKVWVPKEQWYAAPAKADGETPTYSPRQPASDHSGGAT